MSFISELNKIREKEAYNNLKKVFLVYKDYIEKELYEKILFGCNSVDFYINDISSQEIVSKLLQINDINSLTLLLNNVLEEYEEFKGFKAGILKTNDNIILKMCI